MKKSKLAKRIRKLEKKFSWIDLTSLRGRVLELSEQIVELKEGTSETLWKSHVGLVSQVAKLEKRLLEGKPAITETPERMDGNKFCPNCGVALML